MEQLPTLNATVKEWDSAKGAYRTAKVVDLSQTVDFGNVRISLNETPPILDPTDKTPTIVLNKIEGQTPNELYVFELRSSFENPKRYIVGKTIMKENPYFYFSNLGDLMTIQLFRGDPQSHPEMLEITPVTKMGENPSSPLL